MADRQVGGALCANRKCRAPLKPPEAMRGISGWWARLCDSCAAAQRRKLP